MQKLIGLLVLGAFGCTSAPRPVPGPIADDGFLDQYAETYHFRLGHPSSVTVTPKGDAVFFLRSGPRDFVRTLYRFDPETKKTAVFLTAADLLDGSTEGELSPEEKALRERLRLSAKGIARFELSTDGEHLMIPLAGKRFVVAWRTKTIKVVGGKGPPVTAAVLSPDATHLAQVRAGNLGITHVADGQTTAWTTDATDTIQYGMAEFVAQEEMGRYVGLWWSPSGEQLLYQRNDSTAVERFYLGDPLDPGQPQHGSPYPRPGKANVEVRLFIRALAGGDPIEVSWDREALPYVAHVDWSDVLTMLVQNREQTELHMLQIDPQTGATHVLLVEKDAAWVDIDSQMPWWLADGQGFLWSTEREGGKAIELRSPDGKFVRTIVPAEAGDLRDIVDVGEAHITVIRGVTETRVCSYTLAGGSPSCTEDPGSLVRFSGAAPLLARMRMAVNGPTTHTLHHIKDGLISAPIATLESVAESVPFPVGGKYTTVEVEGRVHHALLIRPRNFEAGVRYPVLLSVYGGPGVITVQKAKGHRVFLQWIADHGFIVVKSDNRGSLYRGRVWSRAIKNDLVSVPLADQVAVLQALGGRFPELDLNRVGIYGWSFGGYMAAMAVMQRPDVFQAGVAGAPVTDWHDYDTHYTERFLGLPQVNKAGYDHSSVLTHAPKLERPLLLIHGTDDDNVYFVHTLRLSDALFRAGKAHDLLPLSGHTHMVSDAVTSRHLYGRILGHFTRHLGTPVRILND